LLALLQKKYPYLIKFEKVIRRILFGKILAVLDIMCNELIVLVSSKHIQVMSVCGQKQQESSLDIEDK